MAKKFEKRTCFRCDKALNSKDTKWSPYNTIPMLWGGVIFRGTGNFGSTVYDPMDGGHFLEIYICDECLKEKAGTIPHITYERKDEVTAVQSFSDYDKGEIKKAKEMNKAYQKELKKQQKNENSGNQ